MMESDLLLLKELSVSRNLSYKTKQSYIDALTQYISFNNESLSILLNEAEEEEINGVRWKDRKLKKRLMNFRVYLYDKYLASTAKVYFQRTISFYNHFEIEIHKLPPLSTKQCNMPHPVTFDEIPSKEIIRKAVEIANPCMKAIILFMSSSGCARNETLNLKIGDFIEGTYEWHGETDVKKALSILKDCNNVIPIFKLNRMKTNKFYYTFCSSEASKAIVTYLWDSKRFNSDAPLFNLNLYYFNKYFMAINHELNLGKAGTYNRFRSHMLRKYHASNLYNAGNTLTMDEIDSLQGRSKDATHSSYFMEDPHQLRDKYVESLDAITIFSED